MWHFPPMFREHSFQESSFLTFRGHHVLFRRRGTDFNISAPCDKMEKYYFLLVQDGETDFA